MCILVPDHTHGVAMRTNIEINDGLLKEAMEILGSKTKRAAVEEALPPVLG